MKMSLRSLRRAITLRGLSIQQRLPLLICVLLCSVILTFSFASYYAVKRAALESGRNRLRTLTDQLSSMFRQSADALNTTMLGTAQQDAVKRNIRSGGADLKYQTLNLLGKLKRDSSWLLVAIFDSTRTRVLYSGDIAVAGKLTSDTIFSDLKVGPNACMAGKSYISGDSMYYPVVASVTDQNRVIGWLVSWRSLSATPKSIEQLSLLIGAGATVYLGNTDGSLWTNLMKRIPHPPIDHHDFKNDFRYTNDLGDKVIATLQAIPSTKWLVLVEFSEDKMFEPATVFLHLIFIIGGLLIGFGILITWVISRNITSPLKQLTVAATAIASGNYTSPVKVGRLDELGKLANAFNSMAGRIQVTHLELEKKVRERTIQLETANSEMESFSYSVSHDLRAPLRGIIGFTSILEEKYTNQLDDEAKRLCFRIKKNTMKMGDLIDDLLAFSKLNRSDLVKTRIDTNTLVREVIDSLDTGNGIEWAIQPLPDIKGDINAIRQVWINLISNAIKYSRNNEHPRIEIGKMPNGRKIIFFIRDNGVGFDQQYAGKLFKVFQRLHASNEFEGTGIGLAIVDKIISKHEGKVWVEAEKNKGAKFYFEIPA
jgi:signal transduction histidine kinase